MRIGGVALRLQRVVLDAAQFVLPLVEQQLLERADALGRTGELGVGEPAARGIDLEPDAVTQLFLVQRIEFGLTGGDLGFEQLPPGTRLLGPVVAAETGHLELQFTDAGRDLVLVLHDFGRPTLQGAVAQLVAVQLRFERSPRIQIQITQLTF